MCFFFLVSVPLEIYIKINNIQILGGLEAEKLIYTQI